MPFRVTITAPRRKRRARQPDASELVRRQAEAVRDYLRDSLINGYVPATGEARPRKADGKPRGYDTGKLAKGLRITGEHKGRRKASIRIEPPADPGRQAYVAKHDDIITLDGIVDDVRREAVAEYLAEIDQ